MNFILNTIQQPQQQQQSEAAPITLTTAATPNSSGASSSSSSSSSSSILDHDIENNNDPKVNFAAGIISGVMVAGIFNPWDRALFLSVLHNRPFLTTENFKHPFQGFWQVLVHRTFSSGLYFPLLDYFKEPVSHFFIAEKDQGTPLEKVTVNFIAGNLAGGLSGFFLNGNAAVKFMSWDNRQGFLKNAFAMYSVGGWRVFCRGLTATLLRDSVFGGFFSGVRFIAERRVEQFHQENDGELVKTKEEEKMRKRIKEFGCSFVAGAVGTVVSSPFNFARYIQYGTPAESRPLSTWQILSSLHADSLAYPTLTSRLSFFQNRLRIGWGTARLAVGMAVAFDIYEAVKKFITTKQLQQQDHHQRQQTRT